MSKGGAAAIVGALSYAAMRQMTVKQGDHSEWKRSNFRGRTVSLVGGVRTVGALSAAQAALSLAVSNPMAKTTLRVGAGLSAAAGLFGYIDDMDRSPQAAKGFHGHLGALKEGRVTTGMLKILGIGTSALTAGLVLAKKDRTLTPVTRLAHGAASGALIATSANLANLFDLRPGRLNKVAVAAALPLSAYAAKASQRAAGGTIVGGAALGVAVAGMASDVREETMNGDTGANALGASIGLALACLPLGAQLAALSVIGGLTVASEKISFTKVIESTPALAFLDGLGRRKD